MKQYVYHLFSIIRRLICLLGVEDYLLALSLLE